MNSIIIQTIMNRRKELMGISIICVLLYHLYCACLPSETLAVFKYGYIGVDFFLILSGFGCCFAYEKYNLSTFYKRRFKRILPLFWVQALFYFLPSLVSNICSVDIFWGMYVCSDK